MLCQLPGMNADRIIISPIHFHISCERHIQWRVRQQRIIHDRFSQRIGLQFMSMNIQNVSHILFHLLFLILIASRYGIIAGTTPGMASQNTPHSEVKSLYRTVFLNCFDSISRTSWRESTRGRSKRRNTNPVKVDGNKQQEREYFPQNSRYEYPQGRYPGVTRFHEDSFSEMRASAIFIFSSNSEVAISSSDR